MDSSDKLGQTYSVCPVCLRRLKAVRVSRDGAVYLERDCPEHGHFSTLVWRNFLDITEWAEAATPIGEGENTACPHACGICADHRRQTCCVLMEITQRCNMSCSFCFADGSDYADTQPEPSLNELSEQMRSFVRPGETLLQLSGGEPTVRDDLPEIIREAKRLGCKYVQLNSNGIRLAKESDFVGELAEAGLSFVFMQFDGTDDDIYRRLRGRELLDIKKRAIANCAEHNIGVTLVPTLVRGVNVYNIRDILDFAVSHSPAVRGVHFQPVCFMGRIPNPPTDDERITLDELIHLINSKWPSLPRDAKLEPSCCDHPLCGFHSDFVVLEDSSLYSLNREAGTSCCDTDPSEKNREFVGRRWLRQSDRSCCGGSASDGGDISNMEYFVKRVKSHGFTITAMAFQDAWNLDLERLRSCSLHVYHDGGLKPFCSRYLTAGYI